MKLSVWRFKNYTGAAKVLKILEKYCVNVRMCGCVNAKVEDRGRKVKRSDPPSPAFFAEVAAKATRLRRAGGGRWESWELMISWDLWGIEEHKNEL